MWSDFPLGGGAGNGCGASDLRLQQSAVPPGDPGEHGNGISDSLDLLGIRKKTGKGDHGSTHLAGTGNCLSARMGFRTAALALREDSVSMDDPGLLAEDKLAIILGTEGDGLADEPSRTAIHGEDSYGPWSGFSECGGCQRSGLLAAAEKN